MKITIKSLLLAVALILGGASWAQAQIIAGGGGGNSTVQQFNQVTDEPEWEIGLDDPIGIILDPTAGPWIKQLNTDQVIATEGNNNIFDLLEAVQIVGSPWEDWHQQILTPGWEWLEVWQAGIFNGIGLDPIPGLVIDMSDPTIVSLEFDPLPAGTILSFGKDMIFVGTNPNDPNETFNGTIEVAQWPTPEPTTAAVLVVLGGLTLLRSRRRSA